MGSKVNRDEEAIRLFQREVKAIAKLDHPHILPLFDYGEEHTLIYLVMPYRPEGSLLDWLGQCSSPNCFSPQQVAHIVQQAAGALQHAHTHQIIHQDVKPSNFLIHYREETPAYPDILLADFGIARFATATSTVSQSIRGTPPYMALEQWKGKPVPATDQYGLGVMAYELLTGHPPFQGESWQMMYQHLTVQPAPPSSLNPCLSKEIDSILLTALAKDPNRRFASITTFASAFNLAVQDLQMIKSSNPHLVQSPVNERLPIPLSTALNQPATLEQQLDTRLPDPNWVSLHSRPKNPTLALLGLALLLLFPLFYFALSSLRGSTSSSRPTQNVLSQPPSCICTVKAPTGEYIGISNGNFAFDTNRPDRDLKLQAAAKMKADDFDRAHYLWRQAIAKDTNDAEALIYLEDLRVRESGHPWLTIVIGTTLTGGGIATGQANLRGVYVAQEEYNSKQKLPGGMQVFLLIANSGSDPTYATFVAKQIAQLSQTDKTIVGVMGWTLDAHLLDALPILASAHIPMVSNTGTDELTGRSSYSFRVVASGARQGSLGAQALEKTLHAETVVLFSDPEDDQSRGIATGFTQTFTGDGNIIVATEHFTAGKPQTIPTLLQDALSKHPDAIYFAGRASDAATLLAHLQPTDPPIMGPNALYLIQGYPPAAHPGLSHLHFTAGAYPDEWEFLGLGAQKPPFFADFKAAYDPQRQHPTGTYEYDRPTGNDILPYDAISVLLYASSIALTKGPFLGSDRRGSDLWQILNGIRGKNAFQGVSGAISFGPDGGVTDKATVIMCFGKDNFFKMDAVLGQFLVGAPLLTRFPTHSMCT
jgi:serine/threonine protein kinase/ABC-type branched-subunit amino acid transport system substrate-binding protein